MGMFEQFPYTNFHELNLDALAREVGALKVDIDGLQIKETVDAEMAAQITTVTALIENAQSTFDAQIRQITSLLDEYLEASREYTDDKTANLRQYADEQLADIGVNAIDPVTGIYGPVQAAIYSLYGLHTGDTLSASEYDALKLTATNYDNRQITATDYDLHSKSLLQ